MASLTQRTDENQSSPLKKNLSHENELKTQSLEKNLKKNLNAQTFNKNSSKVRDIIKENNDAITFFNSKVKNEKNKFKL